MLRKAGLAVVLALGALTSSLVAAAPARAVDLTNSADEIYVQASNTGNCLTSDYANTYTYTCGKGGGWYFYTNQSASNFVLRAPNTGLCLSNFSYTAVYTTTCNSSDRGQQWILRGMGSGYSFQNVSTGGYLGTDYSNSVYLSGNAVAWNLL
jgi:hypothetical protein